MKRESYRLTVRVAAAIRAVLMLTVAALLPLPAATITVSNTDDSGAGSLRQAIADAVSGDVIDCSGISGTIVLTSGQLTINKSLTINGPGADLLEVSGNKTFRVIQIFAGSYNVIISGLTICNGKATGSTAEGGGINNLSTGIVTLDSCNIINNKAEGSSARGGGIFNNNNAGKMYLNYCRVENDTSYSTGAGGTSSRGGGYTLIAALLLAMW